MSYNLIECNREQTYLMPVSLENWLPDGHLAWFILDDAETATKSIRLSARYSGDRLLRVSPTGLGNMFIELK